MDTQINVVGYDRIFREEHPLVLRVFWFVLLLGSTGFLAFHLHDRLTYFATVPKTINIDQESLTKIKFPTVTVCNENWVSNDNSTLRTRFVNMITGGGTLTNEENEIVSRHDFVANIGHRIEDMLLFCRINGSVCNSSDFKPITTDAAACYMFNYNGEKVVRMFGRTGGLELMIDAELDKYFNHIAQRKGIQLAVTDNQEFPLLTTEAVTAAPGFSTYVSLQKIKSKYLPPQCADSTSVAINLTNGERYTQKNCLIICMLRWTAKNQECKCTLPMYNATLLGQTDSAWFVSDCGSKMVQCYFLTTQLAPMDCLPKCPRPCESTQFDTAVTLAPFDRLLQNRWLEQTKFKPKHKKPVSWEYFKKNVVHITIYFKDLTVTHVEQQYAYTFLALLSELGGCFGLFMGACLLTIVEVVQILCQLILRAFQQGVHARASKIEVKGSQ